MKTLLVPVVGHEGLESIVATASLAARSFASLIEGSCILPALSNSDEVANRIYWSTSVLPWPEEASREWSEGFREEETSLSDAFDRAMKKCGVRSEAVSGLGPYYRWHAGSLTDDHELSQYARLFSATVVGRPDSSEASIGMAGFESLLFESGRPVLICPPIPPQSLGNTILIAWNGSTETTRTVAFAMPFLRRAKQVSIIEIEGSSVPGPTASELVRILKHEGVSAQGKTVTGSKYSSGEIFIAEARALNCDLIIKGAYTQSRLRQMFFGGATSHLLHHADLPVLMAH